MFLKVHVLYILDLQSFIHSFPVTSLIYNPTLFSSYEGIYVLIQRAALNLHLFTCSYSLRDILIDSRDKLRYKKLTIHWCSMQSISVPRLLSKSEVMLKSFSLRFSIHIWLKDQNYLLIWISTRLAEWGFQGHGFDILHTKKLSSFLW